MRITLLLSLFLLAGYASTPYAQKLYRCDRQYQDRPCDPAPVTIHRPGNPASGPPPDSTENTLSRRSAEEERTKAYGRHICSRYDLDMQDIYASQGRGGENMESLNKRARELDEARRRAGC